MMYKNFDVERVGQAEDVKELFGFTMSPVGLDSPITPAKGALVAPDSHSRLRVECAIAVALRAPRRL